MEKSFKFLTPQEEKKLSNEELLEYYRAMRDYYKSLPIDRLNIKFKETIHPLLLGVVKLIMGNIVVLNGENLPGKDDTCIYCFNHSNGYDFPTAASVVKNHFYILADCTMKKDLKVDLVNRLNGVVYVDRKDKDNRVESKNRLIQLLLNDINVFMFPEGTWNLSPNLLMLPLNWGIIDIAKISGKPIVPSIIEYREGKTYVNVGKPMTIDLSDDKVEKIKDLRDTMATLRWEIMEMFPVTKREDISDDYYEEFIRRELSTYKKLDFDYESSVILKTSDSPDEVFEPIKKLELTRNTAFLFNRNYGK